MILRETQNSAAMALGYIVEEKIRTSDETCAIVRKR